MCTALLRGAYDRPREERVAALVAARVCTRLAEPCRRGLGFVLIPPGDERSAPYRRPARRGPRAAERGRTQGGIPALRGGEGRSRLLRRPSRRTVAAQAARRLPCGVAGGRGAAGLPRSERATWPSRRPLADRAGVRRSVAACAGAQAVGWAEEKSLRAAEQDRRTSPRAGYVAPTRRDRPRPLVSSTLGSAAPRGSTPDDARHAPRGRGRRFARQGPVGPLEG